ncbi:hypothetical protein SOV_46980 [Sporomusa ovata DSM 2662]|uniref:ABC-type nitrate/sulfonate/bicarbonate transport systems, periplasmic components n=1 Tax=Sporomusa ovata TaxID=2378 RepID=A0A0U1KWZ8_9FIRM|nr:ABC transporter substrate-binding protein [Sporomusa ovata]EQB27080.1 ABC-type nitrate/sulfonate/bicarbonate transport system, periplasmic component [Sporomusa ovata DSM 2662]CQR71184.1 ABC-type nitrate/sulfonate/bicarbonate transport systems, periplasmic components [Sporomusa ovata]
MKKAINLCLLLVIGACLIVAGCGQTASTNNQVPTIKVGYTFVDHHASLMVAAKKGEAFQSSGTYLKPVVDKEKYELYSDGKKVANIELIVTKSGAEAASLFAQKHIDLSLLSVTAGMSAIDSGTPIKILSPLQTEGLALVFPKDSAVSGWDGFSKYLNEQREPVKIGYHSPTSAPLMVFEGALKQNKIPYTRNPNELNAKILLVDLKDTPNLIPALTSKQVDGWVGPSPHPQVAEKTGVGRIVLDLRDLPPQGAWHDAPCCAIAGRTEFIAANQDAVVKFLKLIAYAGDYANKNHDEYADIVAQWIGIPADAAKASTIVFLTYPSDTWIKNLSVYQELMNSMNKYKGALKDKPLNEVKDLIFDFSYIQKAKGK